MTQSALPRILFCRANPIAPDARVEKEAHSLAKGGYLSSRAFSTNKVGSHQARFVRECCLRKVNLA